MFDPAILWTIAHWTPLPLDSPGKITWVGCHFLLQEIFPIQGSNLYLLSLLHWQAGSLPVAPSRKPIGANKSLKWKKEKIDVEKVFGFNFLPGYWKWQSLVLCDDLERWNWGRGKGYMHIHYWDSHEWTVLGRSFSFRLGLIQVCTQCQALDSILSISCLFFSLSCLLSQEGYLSGEGKDSPQHLQVIFQQLSNLNRKKPVSL